MAYEGLNKRLDQLDVTLEGIRLEVERSRLEFQRNRAFNREMFDRHDRLARELNARWEEESRRNREVHSAVIERLNELGRDIRAQTEAIFRVIDRLDSNGGPASATS